MRLHWCALDDPGGALGLKNRLIRAVKKMIDLYSRGSKMILLACDLNNARCTAIVNDSKCPVTMSVVYQGLGGAKPPHEPR